MAALTVYPLFVKYAIVLRKLTALVIPFIGCLYTFLLVNLMACLSPFNFQSDSTVFFIRGYASPCVSIIPVGAFFMRLPVWGMNEWALVAIITYVW